MSDDSYSSRVMKVVQCNECGEIGFSAREVKHLSTCSHYIRDEDFIDGLDDREEVFEWISRVASKVENQDFLHELISSALELRHG